MNIQDKINNGREYRKMELNIQEPESYNVRGYATTFNEKYTLFEDRDFRIDEQVDPHAFDECDMRDVIFQYDHEGRVFARTSNDTLKLTPDAHGLEVNAYLGGTEIGRNLFEEIKGGYTSKMSFGFHVEADDIKEEEVEGKVIYTRTIKKINKLYDVSAVSLPANDGTEISARSLKDGAIAKLEAERLLKAERIKAIEEIKARAAALRKDTK
ncbi:MAG: HK97 family phage prohead protease [Clostridiales bacterium]|nr:HK97 family phage prohead protease [Clostridiales bacterium]